MKKLLLLVMLFPVMLFAQADPTYNGKSQYTEVMEGTVVLAKNSSSFTTYIPGYQAGLTVAATLLTHGQKSALASWADTDSLAFILEVLNTTSYQSGTKDTISMEVKVQPLTESLSRDTSTWQSWTQVVYKPAGGSQSLSVFGPWKNLVATTKSQMGRVWINFVNYHTVAQTVKYRLYMFKIPRKY